MAELQYVPFMGQMGASLGQGVVNMSANKMKAQQDKLAGSAYMGDPQAMQELMQVNPQLGLQVQQQKQKRDDATKQKELDTRTRSLAENKDVQESATRIFENVAKYKTFEEAKAYADKEIATLSKLYPEMEGDLADGFDLEDYEQAKTMYGEEPEGDAAFAGTGMPAQVSSALVKGSENPEYRDTAEYARAWDIANEPQIIDTEEGRVPLYPEISPIFKPPGPAKSESEEISTIKQVAKDESQIIKGTEKTKTTADEKVSLGYFNRMNAAEDSIAGLGEFDSAAVWERFKGMTNITASPDLQQYRQAADDWIRSKLRRESGAVIAPAEMSKEYQIYFPQIGDSQGVIDQKKKARAEAANSMKIASGRAYEKAANEKSKTPIVNESDLSVSLEGEVYKFPNKEALQAYKTAAGI